MAKGAPASRHIDLLLIGKTGNGKSATGNTILGREEFGSTDSGQSATLETAVGWTEIDETTVKVVDGPGLMDTRKDEKGRRIEAEEKLGLGFVHCPEGFHALLFVLCYGVRFTEEEEKTLNILRTMLGSDFVKNHCILVFTHGEDYEVNRKNRGKPFSQWLKEQTGALSDLIKECNNRAVLFYNLSDEKREKTVGELLAFVNKINKMYTHDIFRRLQKERHNFIRSFEAIQLEEDIQSDISLLNAMLKPIAGEPDKKVLDPLLDRLEQALAQRKENSKVVKMIRRGIEQAKNGEYKEAHNTFRKIEDDGKGFLVKFWDRLRILGLQFFKKRS